MRLSCPNDPPCPHFLHDIYEPGDPYPTCCDDHCPCGKPGEATLQRHVDGTVTVLSADPVIRVTNELLAQAGEFYDQDAMTLRLDTAGTHVYQYLRPDPSDSRVSIFGRVKEMAR